MQPKFDPTFDSLQAAKEAEANKTLLAFVSAFSVWAAGLSRFLRSTEPPPEQEGEKKEEKPDAPTAEAGKEEEKKDEAQDMQVDQEGEKKEEKGEEAAAGEADKEGDKKEEAESKEKEAQEEAGCRFIEVREACSVDIQRSLGSRIPIACAATNQKHVA